MTEKEFPGFEMPEQNWFKMPWQWTDITAEISSLAELKVVEYVLKHTWGYREYGQLKRISNDEFVNGRKRRDGSRIDKGTGLDPKSVRTGLKRAVARGLLIEDVDDHDKGRIKKFYALRMRTDQGGKKSPPGGENFPPYTGKFPDRTESESLDRVKGVEILKKEEGNGNTPAADLWGQALQAFRLQMTQATFDTHLARTQLLSLTEEKAVIGVPNTLSQDWLENRLKDVVTQTLVSYLEYPTLQVEFVALSASS